MSNPNPNVNKMVEYSKMRTKKTLNKVDTAIIEMIDQNISINFNSVSFYSGVSKRFLYSHSKIKEKIMYLRRQSETKQQKSIKTPNESSKDIIINQQKLKIQKLNEELVKANNELQILYGKLATLQ